MKKYLLRCRLSYGESKRAGNGCAGLLGAPYRKKEDGIFSVFSMWLYRSFADATFYPVQHTFCTGVSVHLLYLRRKQTRRQWVARLPHLQFFIRKKNCGCAGLLGAPQKNMGGI